MNNSIDIDTEINRAARIVETGGVIAFPTDTFYGLGCDPFNEAAVARIFEIKARAGSKAILLLIDSLAALTKSVQLPEAGSAMARYFTSLQQRFWPGPLTIVLPAAATLPANLVSATRTIGVRLPDYQLARRLAGEVGGLITATSANISGQANAGSAAEVAAQLGGRVDYILDGGASPGGAPSTVVDLTVEPPAVVRAGAIEAAEIYAALGLPPL